MSTRGNSSFRKTVLVGLSGGVDSAVAAFLLLEQGYRVIGVTFTLWTDPDIGSDHGCVPGEAVRAAKEVASHLGIRHEVIDLSRWFYEEVVKPFVATYARGWTPNPCVCCNARVRFPALVSLADRLDAAYVATGHYAIVENRPTRLLRGKQEEKDQSYVLARVDPTLLRRLLLPLGKWSKEDVRALAEGAGLPVAHRRESQDICFVPDNDHRRFLSTRVVPKPGPIVDETGRVLGWHSGIHNFTVGQRKGLGIAASQPLYVLAIRSSDAAVVVGGGDRLAVHRLRVEDITWHEYPPPPKDLSVKIRSMGRPVAAVLSSWSEHSVELDLGGRERAASPGQTAVVYEQNRVVCAGTIVPITPE